MQPVGNAAVAVRHLESAHGNNQARPIYFDHGFAGGIRGFLGTRQGDGCVQQLEQKIIQLALFLSTDQPAGSDLPNTLGSAVDAFQTFRQRIELFKGCVPEYVNQNEAIIFLSFGKRDFEALASLVSNTEIDVGKKYEVLIELSRFLAVCAPGVASAVRLALADLSTKKNLAEALRCFRNRVATESIHSFVSSRLEFEDIPVGNEVHHVNAYLYALRNEFGLDAFNDPLAPTALPSNNVECCRSILRSRLSNGYALIQLSEDYRQKVADAVYGSLGLPIGSALSSIVDYQLLKEKIELALEKNADLIGFKPEPELMLEMTDIASGEFSIIKSSNRILQALMVQCHNESLWHEAPVQFFEDSSENNPRYILCFMGNRGWLETGSYVGSSPHRESFVPIDLSTKEILLDFLLNPFFSNNGQVTPQGFVIDSNGLLSELFLSLKTPAEVLTLARYTCNRFADGSSTERLNPYAFARQRLLLDSLVLENTFQFKKEFLAAQIPQLASATLYHFLDSGNERDLMEFLRLGCSPYLKNTSGRTLLQQLAHEGNLSFAIKLISEGLCNPFVMDDVDGSSVSEHANQSLIQKLFFAHNLSQQIDCVSGRMQSFFNAVVEVVKPQMYAKVLCEAALYLDSSQTLNFGLTPRTALELLEQAIYWLPELAERLPLGGRAMLAPLTVIAKHTNPMRPFKIPDTTVLADPFYAFSKLFETFESDTHLAAFCYVLASPLNHFYEQKYSRFTAGQTNLMESFLEKIRETTAGMGEQTVLMSVCRMLNKDTAVLRPEAIGNFDDRMVEFMRRFPDNYIGWTLLADLHLRGNQYLARVSPNGVSDIALQFIKNALSLNRHYAHAWSLLAKNLRVGKHVLIDQEQLNTFDCELRAYAYTPIDPLTGRTIMHTVAQNKDMNVLKRLQKFGCNVNAKDRNGLTARALVEHDGDFYFAERMRRELRAL